ncbi:MAG: helix-turn-helix domain-containing protein [Campylobacter sp.]|nr:helix-turn-helix domain-containing protein [Campylobacter sp.]
MRSKYNSTFKSALVIDMLQNNRTIGETSAIYQVSKISVCRWKKRLLQSATLIFDTQKSINSLQNHANKTCKSTRLLSIFGANFSNYFSAIGL